MKWVFSLFFSVLSLSYSQAVILNGQPINGARSDLVSGYSYAPTSALAGSLNADVIDEGTYMNVVYLGQVIRYAIAESASEALLNTGSLTLNGQVIASTAALRHDSIVYLPVRSFVEALGGTIDYIPQENSVIALTPRAELKRIEFRRIGQTERLSLSFDRFSSYGQRFSPETLELDFLFGHAKFTDTWQGRSSFGDTLQIEADKGEVRLELKLSANTKYESFILAEAEGFQFNLDLFTAELRPSQSILLLYESQTLGLAEKLADDLAVSAEVSLLAFQANMLLMADNSVVLTVSPSVTEASFNVYYAEDHRGNYQILQGSSADPEVGSVLNELGSESNLLARKAEFFARRLSLNSGFRMLNLSPAPIIDLALGQAYWILELNPNDVVKFEFQEALSRTLSEYLAQQ